MHLFVMIILCLVLLRHESEIEVCVSQFLHSALRQRIFGDFLAIEVLLIDSLHRL